MFPFSSRLPLVALFAMSLLCAHIVEAQNYTVIGTVWTDANCDGVRQETEVPLPGITVSLIGQGADQQMYTGDDRLLEQINSDSNAGQFVFTRGGPYGDLYAVAIYNADKPAGYQPAPHQQGADRAIDNDLYQPVAGSPLWATTAFAMHADRSSVTDIDIGLAPAGACSNGGGEQPIEYTERVYLPLVVR
jgi:hypothetical protein